jgi:hypothetical protein
MIIEVRRPVILLYKGEKKSTQFNSIFFLETPNYIKNIKMSFFQMLGCRVGQDRLRREFFFRSTQSGSANCRSNEMSKQIVASPQQGRRAEIERF